MSAPVIICFSLLPVLPPRLSCTNQWIISESTNCELTNYSINEDSHTFIMSETEEVTVAGSTSPTKLRKSPVKEAKANPALAKEEPAKPERKVITKITLEPETVKAAKRLERFGLPEKDAVEAKKTKRAERFGSGEGKTLIPTTPEIEQKKKARAERFGKATGDIEEKKKARSARFGSVAS